MRCFDVTRDSSSAVLVGKLVFSKQGTGKILILEFLDEEKFKESVHKFYEGVIASFDPVKKKHKVSMLVHARCYTQMSDLDVLNLRTEKWELVEDDYYRRGWVYRFEEAENIGYVIPTTVVSHFLDDYERNRKYSGEKIFLNLSILFWLHYACELYDALLKFIHFILVALCL
ncbi:hypothetical protein U1Q18_010329 [Sarracenia purpurea var. burkii]